MEILKIKPSLKTPRVELSDGILLFEGASIRFVLPIIPIMLIINFIGVMVISKKSQTLALTYLFFSLLSK